MAAPLVLCYHAVSEDWPAPLSVTPTQFEQQIRWLARRGYRGVTLTQALSGANGRRVVAVTFDDAFRSVVELAEPILRDHGFVATIFAPTGFVGKDQPMAWPGIDQWLGSAHEAELVPASWEELERLLAGGWEIGSHTVTHPRLTELSADQLRTELTRSKADCESHLGVSCESIAYPYGDHDAAVIDAAAEAGYGFGVTLPARFHPGRPLRWPRVGVYHRDGAWRFAAKSASFVRGTRSLFDRGT